MTNDKEPKLKCHLDFDIREKASDDRLFFDSEEVTDQNASL